MQAGYAGQQGGNAVADVIFGDYNPAGRLPVTYYKSVDQLPDFENYDMEGRTYRYFRDEPLYDFGYGLSYTTFSYSNLQLPESVKNGEAVELSVDVSNSGEMDGDEVVQLYIKDVDAQGPENKKPYKALKSFKRVHVKAGKSEKMILPVRVKDLASYNVKLKKWIVEPRKLDVLIGASSKDIHLKTQIELK